MADRATLAAELAQLAKRLQVLDRQMQLAEALQRSCHLPEPVGGAQAQWRRMAEIARVMERMRAIKAMMDCLLVPLVAALRGVGQDLEDPALGDSLVIAGGHCLQLIS